MNQIQELTEAWAALKQSEENRKNKQVMTFFKQNILIF